MLNKLYKIIIFIFLLYLFVLNSACFFTTFNPKQLINPFYIKNRTKSVVYLLNYIIFDVGFSIKRTDKKVIEREIQKQSRIFKIDPKIIALIIESESKYNEYAISRTGAMGLMQIMPNTFNELGVKKPYFFKDNIEVGVKYLSLQLKRFNNLSYALAAYNAGPNNVLKSKGIPDFSETQIYVKTIIEKYKKIKDKEPVSPYQIPL
jgi:soluble lytic murein transglycosylase-like protein